MLHQPFEAPPHLPAQRFGLDGRRPGLRAPVVPPPGSGIRSPLLRAGVDRILKDRLPWVTEVRGAVDDSIDPEISAAMGRGAYVPKDDY